MSGFNNEVLVCIGERLEVSTSQAVNLMQSTATDVSRVNYSGNPEGNISANPSSLSHDPASGHVYIKGSGTSNTGWNVITATTGPLNTVLQGRGIGVAASFSSATYPQTTTINQILYSSAANTVSELATANNATLVTNGSGVPSLQVIVPGVFGDGSDGLLTFDGTTIVLGITPSANAYTLARDIYLGSSTINTGVSIITNGYKIFCNGVLTNNGTIQWNGPSGLVDAAGTALFNTTSTFNTQGLGTACCSTAGGVGNLGAGQTATNGTVPGYGGRGGSGGTGSAGGGNAGLLTSPTATQGGLRTLPYAVLGRFISGAGTFFTTQGGSGGGGGSGDGAVKGGGGGGGGGVVIIAAFLFAGTGAIQARGGNGGTPDPAGTNCGGGGAGGGGLVIVISRSVISGAVSGQTIDANHGTPGNPQGTGSAGAIGNNGTIIYLGG